MIFRGDDAASEAASSIEKPIHDIVAQMAAMKRELKTLSSQLSKLIDDERNSFVGAAKRTAGDVNATLNAYGINTDALAEGAKNKAGVLQRAVTAQVRENPLRAVAFAIGLGLVIGALSRTKG